MSIIVHIWTGKMPKMAVLNAIYGGNVGHASITIVDLQNESKPIYISHRPKYLIGDPITDIANASKVGKDDSKKYVLKGYAPKAEPISFKKDCDLRKRKPDIEMHMSSSYLNISSMILYYQKYLKNELPESECFYHIGKNNCCSVVVNIIRQGFNCPNMTKICGICDREKYQKGGKAMLWLFRFIVVFSFIIVRSLPLVMNLPRNLSILLNLIFPLLVVFWLLGWFSNIERGVIGLIGWNWNMWSPVTLQVFVKRVNKMIDKKKHKFHCPRTRKGIFGYLKMVFRKILNI